MNPESIAFVAGVFTGVLGMVVAAMFGAMVVLYRLSWSRWVPPALASAAVGEVDG